MEQAPRKPKKKGTGRSPAIPVPLTQNQSAPHSTPTVVFLGTDNPRHLRVLHALMIQPLPREHLDRIAGCSNGPDLVADLRDRGLGKLGLSCTMETVRDRDGERIRRGVYSLSAQGRRAVSATMRSPDDESDA